MNSISLKVNNSRLKLGIYYVSVDFFQFIFVIQDLFVEIKKNQALRPGVVEPENSCLRNSFFVCFLFKIMNSIYQSQKKEATIFTIERDWSCENDKIRSNYARDNQANSRVGSVGHCSCQTFRRLINGGYSLHFC